MSGWNDIISAPKDGTQILGAGTFTNWPDAQRCVVWWEGGQWSGGYTQSPNFQLMMWHTLPESPAEVVAEVRHLLGDPR